MSIAETPIAGIKGGSHRATGDGVHLVARNYRKGVRLDTHMHREAQLVYAAEGMMQVTTPKGRWLVPPDRAVWVPARLEHSIDVLADIEMRTLYFDLAWLAREVGTSARTLSRLFSSETQLSFKSWCQRARIAAAIERLSMEANVSVRQLASELGYASVPAFSHAFRQVTGKTPTEFSETK